MGAPSTLTFKKVNHPGCHQDYRIIWRGNHVGNIRAGFKKGTPRKLRTFEWTARSDVNGAEITVYGVESRYVIAIKLLLCMKALGAWEGAVKIMQTTKDVGWDEKPDAQRRRRRPRRHL